MTNKIFISLAFFLFGVAVLATAYLFLFKKEQSFFVEAACNPAISNCFYRECLAQEECPASELETYRVFEIPSHDFETCADQSCLQECIAGIIECAEIPCELENGDTCISSGDV